MTHWIQDKIYVISKSKIVTQSEDVILNILLLPKYILLTKICILFDYLSLTNNSTFKMRQELQSLRDSMCCRHRRTSVTQVASSPPTS